MSQYRIKQIGNKFYPQKKWAGLFWYNIYHKYDSFSSLNDARNYLDFISSQKTIIHKYP